MADSKHTPGPWIVEEFKDRRTDDPVVMVSTQQGTANSAFKTFWIAELQASELIQRRADAHLIAAAPEMLDALKVAETLLCGLERFAVVQKDPRVLATLDTINAAIAKAVGHE